MKTLVIATNNPAKLREYNMIFDEYSLTAVRVLSLKEFDIPEPDEPFDIVNLLEKIT
jgi:inosine/xanthosine triphosphate pyrophosphatase family protein